MLTQHHPLRGRDTSSAFREVGRLFVAVNFDANQSLHAATVGQSPSARRGFAPHHSSSAPLIVCRVTADASPWNVCESTLEQQFGRWSNASARLAGTTSFASRFKGVLRPLICEVLKPIRIQGKDRTCRRPTHLRLTLPPFC